MHLNLQSSIFSESSLAYQKEHAEDYAGKMKIVLMRRLTWIVLIAYTLLMFKPVMPVVMDVLAHTFWEQQHLLIVHEVNGKFHVHNELVNASHQSDKDKQSNSKVQMEEYLPVMGRGVVFYASSGIFLSPAYHIYDCFLPSSYLDTDNPPPKVSA